VLALATVEGELARRDLRELLLAGLQRALGRKGVASDQCEDFAQDALLRILQQLETFRGDSKFTTWAMTIATRIAFDELRHRRWADVSFDALIADAHSPVRFQPHPQLGQERELSRARLYASLREAIEIELTDKQRAVLCAELEGMPHSEIAASLRMTRNALYKLAHDARKKIKRRLESIGIDSAE